MNEVIDITSYEVIDDFKKLDTLYADLKNTFLEFCHEVAALPDKQTEIAERYGVKQPMVSNWCKIGSDARIINNVDKLPVDQETLRQLTTLTDEQFEQAVEDGAIHPNMKRGDVKVLKGLPTPVEKTEAEINQDRLRKIIKWLEDFTEEQLEFLAETIDDYR